MHISRLFSVLILAASLSGCGSSDVPELASVRGTIQLEGKPLAAASVLFVPADGRPSNGVTNASGEYVMRYNADTEGVVPGKCRVVVSTATASMEDKDGETVLGKPETVPEEFNLKTTLTFEVKAGTDNVANYFLTSDGTIRSPQTGEDDALDTANSATR